MLFNFNRFSATAALLGIASLLLSTGSPVSAAPGAYHVDRRSIAQLQRRDAYQFIRELLCLINQKRAEWGLQALGLSQALTNAAQGHSNDMSAHNQMTHLGSNQSSHLDRINQAGGSFFSDEYENISVGQRTPAEVLAIWMGDEGHRNTMLRRESTHAGIGIGNNNGELFWTLDTGRDGAHPAQSYPACPAALVYSP